MGNTAANVRVGVTGAVYYAALDTALPTSVSGALTAFTELGYVTEDGVTESQPTDGTDIKAWQNGDIVRTIQTSHELTYEFALMETSSAVQTLFYGGNPATATPLEITGEKPDDKAYIIVVDDGTLRRLICIPHGSIKSREDVIYSNSEPYTYGITITCYPDTSSTKAYVYQGTVA